MKSNMNKFPDSMPHANDNSRDLRHENKHTEEQSAGVLNPKNVESIRETVRKKYGSVEDAAAHTDMAKIRVYVERNTPQQAIVRVNTAEESGWEEFPLYYLALLEHAEEGGAAPYP